MKKVNEVAAKKYSKKEVLSLKKIISIFKKKGVKLNKKS